MAGAVAYGWLIMLGLRTWWVDAVGTTALALHVDPLSLIAGAAAVVLIAVASIWWSLRSLAKSSARSLLKGSDPIFTKSVSRGRPLTSAIVAGAGALALLAAGAAGAVPRVAAFFGAGTLSLIAMLSFASVWLRRGRWGIASWQRDMGRVAARLAQHSLPARAQRPLYRADCVCDLRHRRGRSVQARRLHHRWRSACGRRRLSHPRRDASPHRARSQQRAGARRDEFARGWTVAGCPLRPVSCASW